MAYERALGSGLPMVELQTNGGKVTSAIKATNTAETRQQFDLTKSDRRLGS